MGAALATAAVADCASKVTVKSDWRSMLVGFKRVKCAAQGTAVMLPPSSSYTIPLLLQTAAALVATGEEAAASGTFPTGGRGVGARVGRHAHTF